MLPIALIVELPTNNLNVAITQKVIGMKHETCHISAVGARAVTVTTHHNSLMLRVSLMNT
jgi:hypothetical protein